MALRGTSSSLLSMRGSFLLDLEGPGRQLRHLLPGGVEACAAEHEHLAAPRHHWGWALLQVRRLARGRRRQAFGVGSPKCPVCGLAQNRLRVDAVHPRQAGLLLGREFSFPPLKAGQVWKDKEPG